MKRKVRNQKVHKHESRKGRVHRKIARSSRARLTVFRSARHIYAQLEDPLTGRTLGTVSTRSQGVAQGVSSTGSVAAAALVGKAVAELARSKQIDRVVFNRNGFLYHGRIKALAEAAREAGLQF